MQVKEAAEVRSEDPEVLLRMLNGRYSCREFDSWKIDRELLTEIVNDGVQAPSSCNHQNWHFIVITDDDLKRQARQISGGNYHFETCSALIYLCFQKGWTHDKFSIVQSVSAACYHMMLSAHLRGLSSIWNAGIGDTTSIAEMLGVPPTFEIQGALCIGKPKTSAPKLKAPRRPSGDVISFNHFERPSHALYPVRHAASYPYYKITNSDNPFAEWRPAIWGWDKVGDFRGYAVWAKSPVPGVYLSKRQGKTTREEVALVGDMSAGATVIDVLPWGGTHTAELLTRQAGKTMKISVAELSNGNIAFVKERMRQEGYLGEIEGLLMREHRIPAGDASADVVTAFQALEHSPDPERLLDEVERLLKIGGRAIISARNIYSLFGLDYLHKIRRGSVPNQGPFKPLSSLKVQAMLKARFTIVDEVGISLGAGGNGNVYRDYRRYLCRVYAAVVTKRAA